MSENLEQTPNENPRSEVAETIETTAPNNSENNPSEQPSEPTAAPATEPAVDPMNDPRFEAPRAQRFPTWGDMLAVIGIYLLATVGTSIVVAIIAAISGGAESLAEKMSSGPMSVLSYALSMGLTIVGVLIYRKLRRGTGRMFHFSLRGFNPMLILWGFVMVLLTGVVIEPVLELFPDAFLKMINKMGMHGGWSILMLVVLAPVMEEVLFRGYILEGLKATTPTFAILVGGAMFALFHQNPQQTVYQFICGVAFFLIAYEGGSIIPGIAMHFVNNFVIILFDYLNVTFSTGAYVALTVLAIISFITSFVIIFEGKRTEKPTVTPVNHTKTG